MLRLKAMNYFTSVLSETSSYITSTVQSEFQDQMVRLYNDAFIGLVKLDAKVEEKNGRTGLQIDDLFFEITPFVKSVLAKEKNKRGTAHEAGEKVLEEKETRWISSNEHEPAAKTSNLTEPVAKTNKSDKLKQPNEINSEEQQVIVAKRIVTLTNKKNPSDISEFDFAVQPLFISDKGGPMDIVVELKHNDQTLYFVSEQGRKSIEIEIDDTSFVIRGQWKNNKFTVFIYLVGTKKALYNMKVESKDIAPEEILAEQYNTDFLMNIGDTKLYILPYARTNELSGLCKVSIVQEIQNERFVYCSNKEPLLIHIGDINFRIYAKWEKETKQFIISAEQIE